MPAEGWNPVAFDAWLTTPPEDRYVPAEEVEAPEEEETPRRPGKYPLMALCFQCGDEGCPRCDEPDREYDDRDFGAEADVAADREADILFGGN